MWDKILPFLKFQKGKGTISMLLVGVLYVALQNFLNIDLIQVVTQSPEKIENVKNLWMMITGIFARRALG